MSSERECCELCMGMVVGWEVLRSTYIPPSIYSNINMFPTPCLCPLNSTYILFYMLKYPICPLRFAHVLWKGKQRVGGGESFGNWWCFAFCPQSLKLWHFNHSSTLCSCPWKGGVRDWLCDGEWGNVIVSPHALSVPYALPMSPWKGMLWVGCGFAKIVIAL